jgi:hypothetical protein
MDISGLGSQLPLKAPGDEPKRTEEPPPREEPPPAREEDLRTQAKANEPGKGTKIDLTA